MSTITENLKTTEKLGTREMKKIKKNNGKNNTLDNSE